MLLYESTIWRRWPPRVQCLYVCSWWDWEWDPNQRWLGDEVEAKRRSDGRVDVTSHNHLLVGLDNHSCPLSWPNYGDPVAVSRQLFLAELHTQLSAKYQDCWTICCRHLGQYWAVQLSSKDDKTLVPSSIGIDELKVVQGTTNIRLGWTVPFPMLGTETSIPMYPRYGSDWPLTHSILLFVDLEQLYMSKVLFIEVLTDCRYWRTSVQQCWCCHAFYMHAVFAIVR